MANILPAGQGLSLAACSSKGGEGCMAGFFSPLYTLFLFFSYSSWLASFWPLGVGGMINKKIFSIQSWLFSGDFLRSFGKLLSWRPLLYRSCYLFAHFYACCSGEGEEPGGLQSMGLLRVGHDWATSLSLSCIGEGNGNPLQCSCLENPRDGGAWWAAVYGVAQSRTQLKQLSSSSSMPVVHLWLLCSSPPISFC